jgi:hypothetical protein
MEKIGNRLKITSKQGQGLKLEVMLKNFLIELKNNKRKNKNKLFKVNQY